MAGVLVHPIGYRTRYLPRFRLSRIPADRLRERMKVHKIHYGVCYFEPDPPVPAPTTSDGAEVVVTGQPSSKDWLQQTWEALSKAAWKACYDQPEMFDRKRLLIVEGCEVTMRMWEFLKEEQEHLGLNASRMMYQLGPPAIEDVFNDIVPTTDVASWVVIDGGQKVSLPMAAEDKTPNVKAQAANEDWEIV